MELVSHWTDSLKNLIFVDFLKICLENLSKNMIRITDTLHEDLCKCTVEFRGIILRMRNGLCKSCRKNQNKILSSISFFFF